MIPLFHPSIRRADMQAVLGCLADDALGNGRMCLKLGKLVAKYLGQYKGVCVRSVGCALRIIFDALQLPVGSRVGVSVLTSLSVLSIIRSKGLTPVLIDTQKGIPVLPLPSDFDYAALNLDALYVDAHYGFSPDDMVFSQADTVIIENITMGIGNVRNEVHVGGQGMFTLVGLEEDSILTAGGGALVLAEDVDSFAALQTAVEKLQEEPLLSDIHGALALTQFKHIEELFTRRKKIFMRFLNASSNDIVPSMPKDVIPSVFPVFVQAAVRDVAAYAKKHGVTVQRGYGKTVFSEGGRQGNIYTEFINAASLAARTIFFPMFPALNEDEQNRIERILASIS